MKSDENKDPHFCINKIFIAFLFTIYTVCSSKLFLQMVNIDIDFI